MGYDIFLTNKQPYIYIYVGTHCFDMIFSNQGYTGKFSITNYTGYGHLPTDMGILIIEIYWVTIRIMG